MNGLEVYVKSSALGSAGIHWRNISKTEQPPEDPDILSRRIVPKEDGDNVTIEYLINDTKPFLMLAVYENKIFLEITGIEASQERSKRLKREVFDIIAWVVDRNIANERIIKTLVVRTLFSFWKRDLDFLRIISGSIEFSGLDAFQVEVTKISELISNSEKTFTQFIEEFKNLSTYDQSKPVWSDLREVNSDEEADFLACQILQSPLPENTLPFVAVIDARKHQKLYFKTILCESPIASKSSEEIKPDPIVGNDPKGRKKKAHPILVHLRVFVAGILAGLLIGLLIGVFMGGKMTQRFSPQNPSPQSTQLSAVVVAKTPLSQCTQCLEILPCVTA